jgi:hypothetical protein
MTTELKRRKPPPYDPETWGFDEARYAAVTEGLRMTPTERLRWLEETMEEMWRIVGTARPARPDGDPDE